MFLELGELLFFPAAAAFGENAFQQLCAGFQRFPTLGAFGPPFSGERAFHRCFKQRLAVLRQLLLCGFKFGYAGIEIGKEFFEFFDDTNLLSDRSKRYLCTV